MLSWRQQTTTKPNRLLWMISYADMATVLLAMFIVLSTLGKDQTGMNLSRATGSFAAPEYQFGLRGLLAQSPRPVPLAGPTPKYVYTRGESSEDTIDDAFRRIMDGDEENLHQFLAELKRQFPCERLPRQAGQIIIDLYEPLAKTAPHLGERHTEVLTQLLPLLLQESFRADLVVWATTPSPRAWEKAVHQATQAVAEFRQFANGDEKAAARLRPLGQPWRFKDIRRPALSIIVTRQR